ncbi:MULTISPECIES: efflux RND transporter permease subunit [Stenotrophomonas]|uniref:Efflux RND transporter permease subunit n=1 Tax=Stenotrophomonas riyadhensis TaxID=2859893 RepID=A0ABT2XGL7_9GAMM|nr:MULTISPECIES: efflux RND transporter permease subunit [unclassified Stenotrophomonas]ELF4101114.1 efflux RND transporter permease subunit [Stenotrophomonas maltophilia]MBA0429863.1 efflux RND transporter permease subunit [Stenotrophomonas maltophilia]MBH1619740.1 efflux RND transporter permease subunit [Stenotrophomonas maltophilia]MCV0325098.1 efflux RND transporter permease subunit [Stenotrophomonas sp. CFS3442]MDH0275102.1 efflux RND transporter permease subunit [Stenotrophomonas sp. GD0
MRRFNLSEWALANRPLVLFAMLAFALIGAWSYKHLGQSEDPPFTFKAMVVRTLWPGATAEQVSRQVTEPIEKALMNTGEYEFIRSYSRPGESQVIFMARDSLRSKQIPDLWYQVRKRVGDIRPTLPREIVGPFFNDEFGDTYGNIYALTGKGFDYAVMRDYADRIQLELQRVPDVGKIDLVGLQDEKVWIELSNTRLATLGVSMQQVQQALADQNAVTGTSFFETATDRVQLRVTGQFNDIDAIRQFPIRAGDRTVHLGDIAEVKRGFADPASPKMRFMGEEAIGLAVAMKDGGDILKLGANLDAEFERLQKTLPAGMQLRKVSDQPQSVEESVGEFVQVLTEAVVIVLLVSFFSLGLRTGLVVGVTIPLVLAMTFFVMHYFDIGLHKISLGALVLALGLLVDDAIIAVEMMATKMEQGYDRLRAASFAWESTAFPMLTGTLITAAGFLPIATAASSTGEYTRSLFQVVTIALVVSWIAAVLFIPYLGDKMLPDLFNPQPPKPGSLSARWLAKRQQWADRYPALANLIAPPQHGHDHDPYQRPFYRSFRRFLDACLRHRWWVIAATIGLFVFSLMMFRFVPQQFFPDSTRPELMVDIELAEGASLRSTQAQAEKLEKLLSNREGIANYVSYVGTGSPRFYLPLDQQLPATNFAQFVVLAKDIKSRESTRDWLLHEVIPKFPDVQMRVTRLENGPPVGYPVQMRISGEHIEKVQAIARQVEAKVRENPHVMNVNLDWSEPSKVVRLVIDQERARALGVSSAQVSQFLSSSLAGQSVSVYREGNRQIEMLLRGPADERNQLELLSSLSMPTANGGSITLSQVATMEYGFEDGIIWHRNRLPTVTVRADISDGMQPLDVVHQILPTLDGIRAELPSGYLLETGGTVEDSARGQNSIKAGMPLFLVVVATLLMLQLRSFSRAAMVLVTAPLGIIGATLFLLLFRAPFGFVALLGTIALAGMIMRNSVILIDQIQQDIDAGHDRWHSIIDATVRRFRPIVLTALAAVLAMIPLSRSAFYGSMAISIMGGLIVGTVLTLVFLPALYAAWFRVKPDESGA